MCATLLLDPVSVGSLGSKGPSNVVYRTSYGVDGWRCLLRKAAFLDVAEARSVLLGDYSSSSSDSSFGFFFSADASSEPPALR